MATELLTQARVDDLTYDPAGKQNQIYFDTKEVGLAIQVGKTKKSWCIQHHSRPRKRFADAATMTLRSARIEAKELLAKLGKGVDPWGRPIEGGPRTLRELVEAWLDSPRKKEKGPRRQSTIDDVWDQLERFVSDWLEHPYSRVSKRDVSQRFGDISKGRVASNNPKSRKEYIGTYSQAQAVFNYLRSAYEYAIDVEEYDAANPVGSVKKLIPHGKGNAHKALDDDELKIMGKAFAEWPKNANKRIPCLLKLMLFSGMRIRAALEMRWDYIEDDRILMPESQSKSNRIYVVPLTPQIDRELATLRDLKVDEDWVFPSDSASGHMSTRNWATTKLREVCGLRTTNHSLRYSLATEMERQGIDAQVQAMLMDHSSEFTITDRYRQEAFIERTKPALVKVDKVLDKKLGRRVG